MGFNHRRSVLRPLFKTLHGLLRCRRSSALFRPVCLFSTCLSVCLSPVCLSQPGGRVVHNQKPLNILVVDTEILATRALRTRKTHKPILVLIMEANPFQGDCRPIRLRYHCCSTSGRSCPQACTSLCFTYPPQLSRCWIGEYI
jgi:hypothetical protein